MKFIKIEMKIIVKSKKFKVRILSSKFTEEQAMDIFFFLKIYKNPILIFKCPSLSPTAPLTPKTQHILNKK